MNEKRVNEKRDELDNITSQRLGKLAAMPVDLSGLKNPLGNPLTSATDSTATPIASPSLARPHPAAGWLRVAAMVALLAGVSAASYFAFFQVALSTAHAQTLTIGELHDLLLNDPQSAYRSQSTAQTQRLIDDQLAGALALPILEGTRVESCCLVEGEFPLRAALVVDHPEGSVTIIIAQGEDFAHEMLPIEHASGVALSGHEFHGMPMVMRNAGDLWMCVMGEPDKVGDETYLADIAAGVEFHVE